MHWEPNSSYFTININRRNGTNNNIIEARQFVYGADTGIIFFNTYSSIFYCNVGEYIDLTRETGYYAYATFDGMKKTHASFAFIM